MSMNQVAGVSLTNKLKIGIWEMARYQAYHEEWALSLLEKPNCEMGKRAHAMGGRPFCFQSISEAIHQ
jgi:hypothetical protein